MDAVIKEITEDDYNNSTNLFLFKSDGLNRKFGLISNRDVHYVIGWQSDLVNPKVLGLTFCSTAVGIDLNFAIINFCTVQVLVKMALTFNFIDIVKAWERLFLITEMEVFELELESYNVINTYLLPDIYEEIIVSEEAILLKCVDGKEVQIKS